MERELIEEMLPGIDPETLHDNDPFPLGSEIEVIAETRYCDVPLGMRGTVENHHVGGYGVKLNTAWNDALTNGRSTTTGDRVLWFSREQIRRVQP